MKLLILLLTILSSSLYATDCAKNVQKISVGALAVCSGWLVSEPQMQDFAKQTDENKIMREQVSLHEKRQLLTDIELETYKQNNKQLEKEIARVERKSFFLQAGAFALGAILTGFAAKVAIESTR